MWSFFFQAEDGIRDIGVTGVQTCALPIYVPTFPGTPSVFDRVGLTMLGIFPFVVMFLVTSIAMLRERTSGTLERLLTTPLARLDLLLGYGLADRKSVV